MLKGKRLLLQAVCSNYVLNFSQENKAYFSTRDSWRKCEIIYANETQPLFALLQTLLQNKMLKHKEFVGINGYNVALLWKRRLIIQDAKHAVEWIPNLLIIMTQIPEQKTTIMRICLFFVNKTMLLTLSVVWGDRSKLIELLIKTFIVHVVDKI